MLCLGLNPNCSSRKSPRPLTSLKILRSRNFSSNWPIVSRRLMGRYDEGSDRSFPAFRMEIKLPSVHTPGKYCARSAALSNVTSRNIVRCGRCLRVLFAVPLGPGPLVALRPSEKPWSHRETGGHWPWP
jgi:hypothetical protein